MAKSLFITYLLWFFGGVLGLHHFYLRRDYQALVWFMVPGGYFGLGWIRDIWRIPEYVRDANDDEEYLRDLSDSMRKHEKPPSGTCRLFGQMIVADVLGYFALWAIPYELVPEWSLPYFAFATPLAVALGVWLIGNIGRHQGGVLWALIGAYLTYPLYFLSFNNVFWTALVSSTLFNWYGKKWRRTPRKRRSVVTRILILAFWATLYLGLVTSSVYFSCEFKDNNGDKVLCRDAIGNFFTSPLWQEFKIVMWDLYEFAKHNGWWEIWKQLIQSLDPQGEANALKTLNLTSTVTEDELRSVYRKLSRQWHPDRYKNDEDKLLAQDKFIEIQKAYETLSNIKHQRMKRNKASRENPQPAPSKQDL